VNTPLVRLSEEVIEEIAEIARFIAGDNLGVGIRFYDAVQSDFTKLAEMPGMGALRVLPRGRLPGLRLWPVTGFRNYLIFYIPHAGGGIDVLHVVHGARNLDQIL
jgi:toxin ParE1/3/4